MTDLLKSFKELESIALNQLEDNKRLRKRIEELEAEKEALFAVMKEAKHD